MAHLNARRLFQIAVHKKLTIKVRTVKILSVSDKITDCITSQCLLILLKTERFKKVASLIKKAILAIQTIFRLKPQYYKAKLLHNIQTYTVILFM